MRTRNNEARVCNKKATDQGYGHEHSIVRSAGCENNPLVNINEARPSAQSAHSIGSAAAARSL